MIYPRFFWDLSVKKGPKNDYGKSVRDLNVMLKSMGGTELSAKEEVLVMKMLPALLEGDSSS